MSMSLKMKILDFTCYQSYLAYFLNAYKEKHGGLSLRQIGGRFSISASRLSEVVRKKGHLRPDSFARIVEHSGAKDYEKNYLTNLHLSQTSNCKKTALQAKELAAEIRYSHYYQEIDLTHLRSKQWFHYGILFILQMMPEIPIHKVAQLLNISELTATQAAQDLRFDGLISDQPLDHLIVKDKHDSSSKVFHKAMLHKSTRNLDLKQDQDQLIRSDIFNISTKQIPQLKKLIRRFMTSSSMQDPESFDEQRIICLSMQLIPLTKPFQPLHLSQNEH